MFKLEFQNKIKIKAMLLGLRQGINVHQNSVFYCCVFRQFIRQLTNFCKKITNNQVLTARDLSKLAYTLGYFSHEKLVKSDDLLSTCNRVVHSVENVENPSYYIKKINSFLSFIIDL